LEDGRGLVEPDVSEKFGGESGIFLPGGAPADGVNEIGLAAQP